jgi:hypothetical protein
MIPGEQMTDEEFERHTLEILRKELGPYGPYGMARYLRTFRTGTGDYTRDRHEWLDGFTMDEILKDIQDVEGRTGLTPTPPPQP